MAATRLAIHLGSGMSGEVTRGVTPPLAKPRPEVE
jgi:hypothetical protein